MVEKSSVVDFAFKEVTGIDINTAMAILMKKGISIEELSDTGEKLVESLGEETNKKDMDDHYLVLYHMVLSYFTFKTAMTSYNKWIKEVAAEHNMKPDKYAKIIYGL